MGEFALKMCSFSLGFFWKIYMSLNILERALIPILLIAHNYLFTEPSLSKIGLKVAILILALAALIASAFEIKVKIHGPKASFSLVEPFIRLGAWGFTVLEIAHSLSLFSNK
jgi:hypothetical protein